MYENGRWWVIGVTSGPDAGYYRDGRVRTDMAEIEAFTGYSWARPVEPALEMKWVAQDLSGSLINGAVVTSWSRQGGAEAWTTTAADGGAGTPLLATNATPTGRAAVNFGGNSRLGLPAAANPVADETAFTVAMVFKANAAGAGAQGNWFDNTGLLDADEPGVLNDWGVALASTGRPALGVGNPDASLYAGGSSLVDGNWHVLVASWDASEVTGDAAGTDRNMTLYVDSPGNIVRRAGPEFLNMARRAASLTLGGSRNAARYFNGQVAELRLYRGALDEAAAADVLTELRTTYISAAPGVNLTSPLVRRVALPPGQGLMLEGTVTGASPVLALTQTSGPGPAVFSTVSRAAQLCDLSFGRHLSDPAGRDQRVFHRDGNGDRGVAGYRHVGAIGGCSDVEWAVVRNGSGRGDGGGQWDGEWQFRRADGGRERVLRK